MLYVTLRTLGIRGSGNMTRSVNKDLKHDLAKEKKKKVLYVIIDSNHETPIVVFQLLVQ